MLDMNQDRGLDMVGLDKPDYNGLDKSKYIGLDKSRYIGLDTLKRAPFLRPVQIMRQPVSNNGQTPIAQYASYHTNIGLSIAPQFGRESRSITNIPDNIPNPIDRYT